MSVTGTRATPGGTDASAQGGRKGGAAAGRLRSLAGGVTSLPVLAGALLVVTLLASGPLHAFDRALNAPWSQWVLEGWRPLFLYGLDRIASRAVAVPVLALVALVLVHRLRSWRPFVVAGGAVCAVIGLVASMKMVLARPGPVTGNPSFFDGGLFADGKVGIIYPSGHAADAVLLYGVAVYLLAHYGTATRRTILLLSWGVAAITLVTVATSLYLRWHWATDLLGGAVAGGLVLRATVRADRAVPPGLRPADVPLLLSMGRPGREVIRGWAAGRRLGAPEHATRPATDGGRDAGRPKDDVAQACPSTAPARAAQRRVGSPQCACMSYSSSLTRRRSPPMRPASATSPR